MSKVLTKRDNAVASYTEGSGLAELFEILAQENRVQDVKITRFGCDVICKALQTYTSKLLEVLEDDDFDTEPV